MKCIYCNCTESRVVDSRPTEDGAIRRRRECEECKRRFTTYEKIEMLPVLVVKKDRRLVRRVETSVCQQPEEEVTTEQIGRMVMDGLKELDEVAYIRFASVYRQFKDVQSFMEELQLLLDSQKKPQE